MSWPIPHRGWTTPKSCAAAFAAAGAVSIGAVYSGDDSYADSTAPPVSLTVHGTCYTGVIRGGVTVPPGGSDCYGPGSVVDGGINVLRGGSLYLTGAVVHGSILALVPGQLLLCANHVDGRLYAASATRLIS